MCTKNELDSILSEIAKIYQSVYGEQIVKIILYGSYARGDFDSESDADEQYERAEEFYQMIRNYLAGF